MSFTIARRFLFLSTQRAVSHRSRRFGCKAYLVSWILSSFFSLLFFFSSMMFPKKEPRRRRQKMAPKNSKFLFPQKGKSPQNCMSSLLLRKSTWTTTTTFFRQHSVALRFGTARRAMSSSSSGMMARPLVSSMMGHTPRGRASSSSSSINAKTTLRRGERVRTFAFGARKAPKGQLPEREPSMGLDPENAQAKVTHTHTHTHTHTEHFVIEKHFDLFFFFLSFWEIFSSSVERERERERERENIARRLNAHLFVLRTDACIFFSVIRRFFVKHRKKLSNVFSGKSTPLSVKGPS